eukprot:1187826-Prorocentrum_minimum.AAC.2
MEGLSSVIDDAIGFACVTKLCAPGVEVVVVRGQQYPEADFNPRLELRVAPGVPKPFCSNRDVKKTVSLRSSFISLKHLTSDKVPVRKTKIVCTLGPKC